MLFNPWYSALMLALECTNVIHIRLRSIAAGRVNPLEETGLMVTEKVDAVIEAGAMMMRGGQPAEIIAFYREHVAANAARLS